VRSLPVLLLLLTFTVATPSGRGGPGFDVWLTGSAADATPASTRAGLLLLGGGGDVPAAWRWFVACAGGGDIVVLRASGADGYNDFLFRTIGGVDSVQTIRFNSAAAARDPAVLALIAAADGLFLAGGDQARYVRYWKDTPVEDAINAHLRAGKPLGGTSAGLAVLGEHHFAALEDSITSEQALRDPFDRRVTLGRDFIAAPALRGVLTDSHFMARRRLGRLIAFLGRLSTEGDGRERLLGLGIDEGTALCIEPEGPARVFTEKKGLAWLVLPARPPRSLSSGKPLEMADVTVIGLGPDSELNLRTLEVSRPAALSKVSTAGGALTETK
jgi:cyanophycinase